MSGRISGLVVAVVVGLVGCGGGSGGRSPGSTSRTSSAVAFVGSWSAADESRARLALAMHVDRFAARYGSPGPVHVEVHAGPILPSGAVGEALLPQGFRIAAGADLVLAGATHELHHLTHDGSYGHVDQRWPSWDAEDQATVEAIIATRTR
jgi:hypothetical protein